MGAFDDLIPDPQNSAPSKTPGGAFADLVPAKKPRVVDMTVDPRQELGPDEVPDYTGAFARDVGPGEAAMRGLAIGGERFNQLANMLGGGAGTVIEAIPGVQTLLEKLTGNRRAISETGFAGVDDAARQIETLSPQRTEHQGLVSKVAGGVGQAAPDVALALLTGGESVAAQTAIQPIRTTVGAAVRNELENAALTASRASVLPGATRGVEVAREVQEAGGSTPEALLAGGNAALATGATNIIPASASGSAVVRALQGAASNPVADLAQQELENAAIDDRLGLDQSMGLEDVLVSAITGAPLAAGLGERGPDAIADPDAMRSQAPGIVTPQANPLASAIAAAMRGEMPDLDPGVLANQPTVAPPAPAPAAPAAPAPRAGSAAAAVIDRRLAALREAAAGQLDEPRMRELLREQEDLDALVREQDSLANVMGGVGSRLTPDERAQADEQRVRVRRDIEAARTARGAQQQLERLETRLSRIDRDADLAALADEIEPPARAAAAPAPVQAPTAPTPAPEPTAPPAPAPAPVAPAAAAPTPTPAPAAPTASRAELVDRWRQARTPDEKAAAAEAIAVFDGGQPAQPSRLPERAAVVRGEDDSDLVAVLGPAAKGVTVVRSNADLPADVAERVGINLSRNGDVEGFYDPDTGQAFVIESGLDTTTMPAAQRKQWVAAHERAGHAGLRGLFAESGGQGLRTVLGRAEQNPTVAALSAALRKQRPQDARLAVEEAVSELAAAVRTGNYDHIRERYGVDVPEAQRATLKGYVDRLVQQIKRAFGWGDDVPDAEVYKLIEDANRYVRENEPAPTRRAREVVASRGQDQDITFDDDFGGFENNASGESAASLEAIGRVREERDLGRVRMVIERNGTVRPLVGVDAVDTFARPGQVIVQRNLGGDEWTAISTDPSLSREAIAGRINAARGKLAEALEDDEVIASRRAKGEGDGQEGEQPGRGRRARPAANQEPGARVQDRAADRKANRAAAVTETPAFKRWFGDSKVVDDNGDPMVVYHGSPQRGITTFDMGRSGERTDYGNVGIGVYTSPKRYLAAAYAKNPLSRTASDDIEGEVLPLYLSIQNPLRVVYDERYQERIERVARDLGVDDDPKWRGGGPSNRAFAENFTSAAKAAGYDGALTTGSDGEIIEAVAYSPEQIKSATGNRGTFDRNDPSIIASRRAPVTDTPQFRRWFDGSKIVDDNGEPLVVHHGTRAREFDTFDMGKALDGAHWFTGNESHAASFGPAQSYYLAIKNPMEIDDAALESAWDAEHPDGEQDDRNLLPRDFVADFVAEAKAKGHDGLIIREMGDRDITADMFLAFEPGQIKSATRNRGGFDRANPSILASRKRPGPVESAITEEQTDTAAFKRWSGDAPVFEGEQLVTDYEGGPAVFKLFHGTTADFDTFDRERANVESDFGAGFYFSNNPDDVAPNYAGVGPDLTNKVQREAERIASEEDLDYDDPDVVARARARWIDHGGATMQVFVRTKNPAIVGGDNETRLTYEEAYDEDLDEYGEPTGTLVDFVDNLRNVAADYQDADAEEAISVLFSEGVDGDMPLSTVIETLKGSEGLQYATDDNGDMASSEIIRRALEETGFDAVVDYTVNTKFGSQRDTGKQMEGMDENTVHVIAFEPNQVKSATGNRGTFDPNDPSIVASRVTPAVAQQRRNGLLGRLANAGLRQGTPVQAQPGGRFEPLAEAATRMRTKFQDAMLPVLEAQERAGGGGSDRGVTSWNLADTMNAYRLENLMHGRVQDRAETADIEFIRPMQQQLKRANLTLEQLSDYVYALHAPERNAQVAKINKAMPDAGSGIATKRAQDILAGTAPGPYSGKRLTPADIRVLADVYQRRIVPMRERTLDYLVEAQTMTPQLRQQLKTIYPNYVPMRGKESEFEGFAGGTGKGLNQRRNPIKRALGRGNDNIPSNVIGELVGDLQRSIVDAEKARANRAFLKFALANPMDDLFKVEPVDREWKFSEATGEAYQGVRSRAEDADRLLTVMHNGEPVNIRFEDPALRDAVRNMGAEDYRMLSQIVGKVNRWRSAVLTRFNPAFSAVNVLRDLNFGLAAIASEKGPAAAALAAKNYLPALRSLWRDQAARVGNAATPNARKTFDDWAREYAEAGAKTGQTKVEDPADLQRNLSDATARLMRLAAEGKPYRLAKESVRRTVAPIASVIERVNDATENALRLSVYIEARKKGDSVERAAEYAKNVTINFNRRGQFGPALNALYLFYNASMQGTHAVQRVLRRPGVQAYLLGLMGLQGYLAQQMMSDDEDLDGITAWDTVPDYVKRTSLVIPLGSMTGNDRDYFALPMPYGFNLAPYAGGRAMQRYQLGDRPTDKSVATDMTKSLFEAFSPLPVTDGYGAMFGDSIGLAMQLASNKDDLGRPIANEPAFEDYPTPAALTGRADTPRAYQAASQLLAKAGGGNLDERIAPVGYLDVAPEQIEAVTDFALGGIGNLGSKGTRWWEQMDAGNFEDGMDNVSQLPILSRLVGRGNAERAIAERYYGERGELSRKLDVIQDRVREGGDPDQVLADAAARDPSLGGLSVARRKREGKRGEAEGSAKRTSTGGVQIDAEDGYPAKVLKDAEKANKALGKAIRTVRNPDATNADIVAAVTASLKEATPEALGLPDGYKADTTAPNRVRQRAIKLLQEARAKEQQTLLKSLRLERSLDSVRGR